jgi:hypothetical protein
MKKKKWLILVNSIIFLLLLGIMVFGIIIVSKNIEPLTDLTHLSDNICNLEPRKVSIEGVKIYTQPGDSTCGIATISTVVSYLKGEEVSPEELLIKHSLQEKGGMGYDGFLKYLSSELPEFEIEYAGGLDDSELIEAIHNQLAGNIPVPVFLGSPNLYNEPFYDFHASVITGIDLERNRVNIANVYGYEEEISLLEFLNRMSYREIDKYPFMQKLIIKMELIDNNSIFFIK